MSSAHGRKSGYRTIIGLLAGIGLVSALLSPMPVAAAGPAAPDGPGALFHFDLARKDCLGTSRSTASKVWYTVAGGVLSDVYFPTADNPNAETLQFLVTDGATFTDLQSRDTTYTASLLNERALDCQVVSTARSGRYRIVTEYLTDPTRNTLLLRSRFEALVGKPSDYHVYVRFDPTLNGNGGGGSANAGGDTGGVDTST